MLPHFQIVLIIVFTYLFIYFLLLPYFLYIAKDLAKIHVCKVPTDLEEIAIR